MKIAFDPGKSARNEAERGFGFDYASQVFAGEILFRPDTRFAYTEARFVAIGMVDGRLLSVVYADLGDIRRIISARMASRKERKIWQTR